VSRSGDPEEEELPGSVGAVRVGSTVRKVKGSWTPTVHALLRFLADAGFDLAPKPLGFDDRGREVLTWLDGTPGMRPWPEALLRDEGVVALAGVLRRYHDVVRDFDPGEEACWRVGCRALEPGEIVCHGDFAPWNTVWTAGRLVGVIDWDMAEPGIPLADVTFLAQHLVPLRSDAWARGVGFDSSPARDRRLALLCETYGRITPGDVIASAPGLYERDRDRTLDLGGRGREPWATFLREGALDLIDEDVAWLREHATELRA
jgi:hypothetical protein